MTHESGTYVALELSPESRQKIDKFITETLKLPNPIDPDYLHTTIIYSTSPVPDAKYLDRETNAHANFLRYEVFHTKTGKDCLTIIVDCPKAHALNRMLTKLGATSNFNPYCPHLTLSYDYVGTTENLPKIPFELLYQGLIVNALDPTFIPPSK